MGKTFPLTLKERKEIKYFIDQMLSLREISQKIGRSNSCINNEVRRYGGRDKYDPIEAHKKAMDANEDRIEKLKLLNEKSCKISLEQRISNIEMQIDILITTIKELKK